MNDEAKPKRKYRRRQKVEPLAVYAVVVTVKRGRATETIYGESVRTEGGCLVVTSMDGPPPLVEKTRYIPLGSAEIEVCQRPVVRFQPFPMHPPTSAPYYTPGHGGNEASPSAGWNEAGPRIIPGPLEVSRQRQAAPAAPRPVQSQMVERNADGVPVVTAGFLDGSPT